MHRRRAARIARPCLPPRRSSWPAAETNPARRRLLPTAARRAARGPVAEVYAEIRVAVEAIRGLAPTAAVDPVTLDPDQLATNLRTEFDAENPAAELADAEDLLITLGLLPAGTSLRDAHARPAGRAGRRLLLAGQGPALRRQPVGAVSAPWSG